MCSRRDELALQTLLGEAVRTLFSTHVQYSKSLTVEGSLGVRIDDHLLLLKVDEKLTATEQEVKPAQQQLQLGPCPRRAKHQQQVVVSDIQTSDNQVTKIAHEELVFDASPTRAECGGDENTGDHAAAPDPVGVGDPPADSKTIQVTAGSITQTFTYLIEEADAETRSKIQSYKSPGFDIRDLHSKRKVNRRYSFKSCQTSCKQCPFVARTVFAMRQHMVTKHGSTGHVCIYCKKQFTTPLSLQQHKKLYHPKTKDGHGLCCEVCNKEFRSRVAYQTHKESQHEGLRYECPFCNKQFKYRHGAQRHMQKCPLQAAEIAQQPASAVGDATIPDFEVQQVAPEPMVQVSQGESEFDTVETAMATANIEQEQDIVPQETEVLERTADDLANSATQEIQSVLTKRKRIQKSLSYKCDMCASTFATNMKLISHIQHTHAKPEKFKCSVCTQTFATRSAFQRHKRLSCPNAEDPPTADDARDSYINKLLYGEPQCRNRKGPQYKSSLGCDICGKRFTRKDALKDHIIGFHSRTNQYSCTKCGETFRYRCQLAKHKKRGHYKYKPTLEAGAPKTVHGEEVLVQAIANSTQPTEAPPEPQKERKVLQSRGQGARKRGRPRKGSKQGYGASEEAPEMVDALEKHIEEAASYDSSEPVYVFKCGLCLKQFTRKGSLQDHLRAAHMDYKPFVCSCGERFTYRTHLHKHRKRTSCEAPVRERRRRLKNEPKKASKLLQSDVQVAVPMSQVPDVSAQVQVETDTNPVGILAETTTAAGSTDAITVAPMNVQTLLQDGTQVYIVYERSEAASVQESLTF